MSELYDEDIVLWSDRQAKLLRRRGSGEAINEAELDWPNLAEEIASLDNSEKRELRSHLLNVVIHLIKLQASPATEPRAGWRETIREQRDGIETLLEDSPSLCPIVDHAIKTEIARARRRVHAALADHGEQPSMDLEQLAHTREQVLGPWLPGEPSE